MSAQEASTGTRRGPIRFCLHHARLHRYGEVPAARNERLKKWPARGVAIGLVGGAIAVAVALYPHYIKLGKNPSLVDQIFQSRTIVVLIRVVLLFAAGFIVASLLARIWNRQWLSKAGPFEISDVVDLTGELDAAEANLAHAEEDINKLNLRISASDRTIEELLTSLDAASTQLTAAGGEIATLQARLASSDETVREILELLQKGQPSADNEENDE